MPRKLETTEKGIRPSHWHLSFIASRLAEMRAQGLRRIMLSQLPEWKRHMGCRTEDLVEMIEYLVETRSPLMDGFSLDMHLVDAIIQCRLRREGKYDRREWVGGEDEG